MRKHIAALCVAAAGFLWGIIGIFVRIFTQAGLSPMQTAAVRITVTAVIMTAGLLIFNRRLLFIRFRHIWCFIGTGLISIVMFTYCYFRTIGLTSLSAAAVLLYTAPVMVMAMSAVLFGEKVTVIKIVACAAAFAGCILVSGVIGSERISAEAVITGLLSAFGYALYSIFGRYALGYGYHPLTITAYTFIFACAGVLPLCGLPDIADKLAAGGFRIIALGVLLGVLTAALPYFLYTAGLAKTEPGRASVIASVEPAVATLAGILFFNETPTSGGFCGIALVITAVILMNFKKEKSQ